MAYQPKYLKQEAGAPQSRPSSPLGGVIAAISLVVTAALLWQMIFVVGRGNSTTTSNPVNTAVKAQFGTRLDQQLQTLQAGLNLGSNVSLPSIGGDDTTEPTEAVKMVYEIPAGTQIAPEPNQDLFGETDDPSTLDWLLEEAQELLDGQELFFSTDVELFEGSTVHYYLDETIFAITWKQVQDGSVYTYSEVKVAHPSQFRRHLSGGQYGSGKYYHTTDMAATVNAVVASGGDFYSQRTFGVCVYEGELQKMDGVYSQTCFIDSNGDLSFVYAGELTKKDQARAYIEENDIQFSLCFGPVLVDNYEMRETSSYGVGEPSDHYARAALCQMGTLHYLIAVANTEGAWQRVPTVNEFAKNIVATGCRMAYSLDGGQTASIVMNDELINRPVKGEQRNISDIIYFATAIPEEG